MLEYNGEQAGSVCGAIDGRARQSMCLCTGRVHLSVLVSSALFAGLAAVSRLKPLFEFVSSLGSRAVASYEKFPVVVGPALLCAQAVRSYCLGIMRANVVDNVTGN